MKVSLATRMLLKDKKFRKKGLRLRWKNSATVCGAFQNFLTLASEQLLNYCGKIVSVISSEEEISISIEMRFGKEGIRPGRADNFRKLHPIACKYPGNGHDYIFVYATYFCKNMHGWIGVVLD